MLIFFTLNFSASCCTRTVDKLNLAMVLGLRSLSRRESSVHVDYVIHLQEIKPWPTYNMKSSNPVILHWERGDRHSGSTKRITPQVGPGIGDGKIVLDESFLLPATLFRGFYNRGSKSTANEKFHKKCLDLNLHESKSERVVKGQLLGCAVVDLAQYGVLRSITSISVPLKLKKGSKIAAQPLVFLTIGPDERNSLSNGLDTEGAQASPSPSSSPRYTFSSGTSLDKDSRYSIADTEVTDEGIEEVQIASFSDEEPSPSHSMSRHCASASEVKGNAPLGVPQLEKELELVHIDSERDQKLSTSFTVTLPAKAAASSSDRVDSSQDGLSSLASSTDLSKYSISSDECKGHLTLDSSGKNGYEANILYSEIMTLRKEVTTQAPVAESMVEEEARKRSTVGIKAVEVVDKVARQAKVAQQEGVYPSVDHCSRFAKASMEKQPNGSKHTSKPCRDPPKKGTKVHTEVRNGSKNGPGTRVKSIQDSTPKNARAHTKSISSDSDINSVSELDDKFIEEVKEINISEMSSNNENGSEDIDVKAGERISTEENKKIIFAEARAAVADEKVKQMELEIEKLEGELREAAVIEAAVYAVAAEHGGSSHKVHSPARRLARFYIHACKHWTQERRASAARTAASALILVAKACGNDVPRLTFWWSNTVVLRGIISQAFDSSQSLPQVSNSNGSHGARKNNRIPSPQKSRDNFPKQGREKASLKKTLNDWQETQTFTTALQEIESWIHGRVIESVWWQTLTPYMHGPSEDEMKEQRMLHSRQRLERLPGPELGDRRQGKFSVDLWKKAFLDSFQRLCPVRAGGHECGCLPVLAKMVMEQCLARLDVAMFNAILRQSKEEMPTDPISDPISDLNVLPIPFGNLCFGSGAQLKNAVGNWSRYLTEVVGIDADDSCQALDSQEDNYENVEALLSSFPLLNATSELLMLPKEMLMDKSIRKEVCPMLSLPLIKRILCNFVPDEFCPDPMPLQLMESLNAEIPLDRRLHAEEDSTFSCLVCAPSTEYSPPPESSFRQKIGDANDICFGRSASGVMRKGYTSDDEIDEFESPLSLLVDNVPEISPQTNKLHSNGKYGGYAKRASVKEGVTRRYQLLREAWVEK